MLKRVNQVISALTARIEDADRDFIDRHLTKREQNLFWAMSVPDQRHALNVAYTAIRLSRERRGVDLEKLTKCCLLHDAGRVRGDVGIIDKIVAVIAHKAAPRWAESWGRPGKGSWARNLRHAFYVYDHHAERSRQKLLAIGLVGLGEIVSRHHKAPAEDDPPELTILRQADDLN